MTPGSYRDDAFCKRIFFKATAFFAIGFILQGMIGNTPTILRAALAVVTIIGGWFILQLRRRPQPFLWYFTRDWTDLLFVSIIVPIFLLVRGEWKDFVGGISFYLPLFLISYIILKVVAAQAAIVGDEIEKRLSSSRQTIG